MFTHTYTYIPFFVYWLQLNVHLVRRHFCLWRGHQTFPNIDASCTASLQHSNVHLWHIRASHQPSPPLISAVGSVQVFGHVQSFQLVMETTSCAAWANSQAADNPRLISFPHIDRQILALLLFLNSVNSIKYCPTHCYWLTNDGLQSALAAVEDRDRGRSRTFTCLCICFGGWGVLDCLPLCSLHHRANEEK